MGPDGTRVPSRTGVGSDEDGRFHIRSVYCDRIWLAASHRDTGASAEPVLLELPDDGIEHDIRLDR